MNSTICAAPAGARFLYPSLPTPPRAVALSQLAKSGQAGNPSFICENHACYGGGL